jgi:peptidyl-prolyl cis-trans isomerase C
MKALYVKSAVAAVALAAAGSAAYVFAQQAEDSQVVARIGELAITERDLDQAQADFAQELAQVPAQQRRSVLIDVLVDMELLAQAAREQGMHETPEFQERLAFLETRALRNLYVEREIVEAIEEDEIAAAYEETIQAFEPQEEIHARHILVETEEEAREAISRLDEGADFADLARQISTDPAAAQGGDLGYVGRGRLVQPFEEAAFALEPGEHSEEPVQTQFGWHVIKVEDQRMSSPPPLEQVRNEIRTVLMRQRFEEVMTELRARTEVEILAQPEPGPGAAGEPPAPAQEPAEATPEN